MASHQSNMVPESQSGTAIDFGGFREQVLRDYALAVESREASLLGRKEVLTGKAKFGIFGDGKELPQIALSKFFRNGDFRSGYYRDQTLALATGMVSLRELFSQLYADTDIAREPQSGGRMMNAHFATRLLNGNGEWNDQLAQKNTSADASPTGSQMPRALGLALASKYYRTLADQTILQGFSQNGDEVVFTTIGDASTSEGVFWETLNAAGVLRVPMVMSVWDDGYGISVPIEFQTTKGSISEIVSGFLVNEKGQGMDIYVVNAWDYAALVETYEQAVAKTRETHIPCLVHVKEVTQPQGHSTSGSHERYKTKERLEWEREFDCIRKMREWVLANAIATDAELDAIENEARQAVNRARREAWEQYLASIKDDIAAFNALVEPLASKSEAAERINGLAKQLNSMPDPLRRSIAEAAREILYATRFEDTAERNALARWTTDFIAQNDHRYNGALHSTSSHAALNAPHVPGTFDDDAPMLNGFEVLNRCFDAALQRDARVLAFGEDLGRIGDVNQGFAGLQAKHGDTRVFDTGIREATIIGQGMGMAMRGLRPIAEIQYLDYLLYGLQPISDDLATLRYRTANGQQAPLIIRTRGHRLEGIWHTGSPMGMIVSAVRGVYVCVPRNMTQAAGFYNLLLQSDDPAIVVECLNGYRLKEKLPSNVDTFTVLLGVPEILREGTDLTLVTYGSCCRIAQAAAEKLHELGISIEIVDVQTLLPFDINHMIRESVKKTNRVLFFDEDVPGGATAFMMQQVLEHQDIFRFLDALPRTLAARPNRAAYGSDGDYFCKPSVEDVVETVYGIMSEADPAEYPALY